jgi:hypothetical protein
MCRFNTHTWRFARISIQKITLHIIIKINLRLNNKLLQVLYRCVWVINLYRYQDCAKLFVIFRCWFYFHLTTRLLIRHKCVWLKINFASWIKRWVANCIVLRVDSSIMRVKSTRRVFLLLHSLWYTYRINTKILTLY